MRTNEQLAERIGALTIVAEEVLEAILRDPSAPAGVRQRAATFVLEYGWPAKAEELRIEAELTVRQVLEDTEVQALREWVREQRRLGRPLSPHLPPGRDPLKLASPDRRALDAQVEEQP